MQLEIVNVTKKYGRKKALYSFSASLTNGVYALLGPNGAGKSTLMNIITDIIKPTSGDVLWNGRSIYNVGDEFRRLLGFLPQSPGFYKSFTGYEFLSYIACLKGMTDKKEIKSEVCRLLEKVNMTDAANRKIGSYSGGMRQRIGIAQALIGDPKLLIFDEPTAGLDPTERIRFKNIISEMSLDCIVILATHIVSDVSQIAKNVMLIGNGNLIENSSANELISKQSLRVWNVCCNEHELKEFMKQYKIASIQNSGNDIAVRLLSDEKPCESAVPLQTTLEDIYLHYFGKIGSVR